MIPPARPVIGDREIEAAVRVLRTGKVAQGPEVAAFELEFGELVEGRQCVAVNSGTSALQLTLLALGVGPGDEVVVPSFSFAAPANAIRLVGATPVFADIDPATFCLAPDAAAAVIGPRTVAIMPVHQYGHPAAMDELAELAERHGLALVEDAAQAHTATLNGRPVGTFGTAGCFSFHLNKNTHSLEGGMITTADADLARRIRLLRNQGTDVPDAPECVGGNLRLTDVAAAIGRVQLAGLAVRTQQRQLNAKFYDSRMVGVLTPRVADGAQHVYHQYTLRVDGRDSAQQQLLARGIGSMVYCPTPIHRLRPFLGPDGRPVTTDLPETDRATAEVLSVPVYPGLTTDELDRIVEAVNDLEPVLSPSPVA